MWAVKTDSMVLIHSPSGVGKTFTLQALRAETPGAVYFSVDSASRRVHGVLSGIAKAMRLNGVKLTTADLFDHLVPRLKDSHRLLIIDEAHLLAGRSNDDALQILRHLHDKTGCPWFSRAMAASPATSGTVTPMGSTPSIRSTAASPGGWI